MDLLKIMDQLKIFDQLKIVDQALEDHESFFEDSESV